MPISKGLMNEGVYLFVSEVKVAGPLVLTLERRKETVAAIYLLALGKNVPK